MTDARLTRFANAATLALAPAFGAAWVLDRFATSSAILPELARPLLVAMAIGAILTAIGWAITRHRTTAALLASVAVLGLALHPVPGLVVGGIGAWHLAERWRRRESMAPAALASVYAVLLLGAGAWTSWSAIGVDLAPLPELPRGNQQAATPNIYVLLLDGYPRSDTLQEDFAFDNAPFEAGLEELGFEIASEARSNHNKTWLTQATLLNAQYVAELPEIVDFPRDAVPQIRLSHALINQARALEMLRERGYRVVSIPSALPSTDITTDAEVRTDGHLTGFEISLASSTLPVKVVPGLVLDALVTDARAKIGSQLDAFAEAAEEPVADAPQVVLAHLMAPHPPLLLGQEPDYLRPCFADDCSVWESIPEEMGIGEEEFAERTRTQVAELNRLVLASVERVVAADPEAIVVVFSDHGVRRHPDADDEHFGILFAARAPGLDGLFAPDQAPVNVFRRIGSRLFGDPLPDLPYRAWASDWDWTLELTPRTE